MSSPSRCPYCGTQSQAGDAFCRACDALLPSSGPVEAAGSENGDHEATGSSTETGTQSWPARDLQQDLGPMTTCPRCDTRNPGSRTYCWRCFHELGVSDEAPLDEPVGAVPVAPAGPAFPDAPLSP